MVKQYIIETEKDVLPSHWTAEGRTSDGRRIMDVFDDVESAQSYIDEFYGGMYESDVIVESEDEFDAEMKDSN